MLCCWVISQNLARETPLASCYEWRSPPIEHSQMSRQRMQFKNFSITFGPRICFLALWSHCRAETCFRDASIMWETLLRFSIQCLQSPEPCVQWQCILPCSSGRPPAFCILIHRNVSQSNCLDVRLQSRDYAVIFLLDTLSSPTAFSLRLAQV